MTPGHTEPESQTMIGIRKYQPGDAVAVSRLISQTYARFCRNEGTRAAVRRYVETYDPKGKPVAEIRKRFARTPYCFVAVHGSTVVGVVRGTANRIGNLYVDARYHRRGLATRLVQRFEGACRKAGSEEIVLRSSLYAIPFYQSVGYKKTTGVRNFHGHKVQPMRKKLK